jgi:hypothetical protein
MCKYLVRVTYEYPVDSVNAKDALSTVPMATRLKYLNADGTTEIINSEGKVVLKAKLVNKRSYKDAHGALDSGSRRENGHGTRR